MEFSKEIKIHFHFDSWLVGWSGEGDGRRVNLSNLLFLSETFKVKVKVPGVSVPFSARDAATRERQPSNLNPLPRAHIMVVTSPMQRKLKSCFSKKTGSIILL